MGTEALPVRLSFPAMGQFWLVQLDSFVAVGLAQALLAYHLWAHRTLGGLCEWREVVSLPRQDSSE